jgi:all-trans-8'-apo-beta-carotenal 15,15'-oxygenase
MRDNETVVAGDKSWLAGLAASMTEEHDYPARVEGALPAALQGTLYRNGPGRFELGGVRKTHLLDGDGMIQAFDFCDGKVRYRNRFVRTEKYLAEQRARRLTLPTWTTRAPGGMLRNMGNRIKSQAGVTTLVKNGCLYAFDEVGLPYGLDPGTLETIGPRQVGPDHLSPDYKAHTKTDGKTGEWLLLAVEHGPRTYLHLCIRSADGALRHHQRVASPRGSYIHDWFVTERHVLVLLHPLELGLGRFLSGMASFTDSLQWKPQHGNLLMIIDRSGAAQPKTLETSACFMWHSLNAYEEGGRIIADFVGYAEPDHFIGEKAAFRTIMEGRQGLQEHAGTVRRYLIDAPRRRIAEETVSPENHEFPIADPRVAAHRHRFGYFTTAPHATVFHNGLARLEMDTGKREHVYLDDTHLGEPIFVPDSAIGEEQGWLLSVGLDGRTGNSFLGVFRSDRLADGPTARVLLQHPTPLSFHGYWHDRAGQT